MPSVEAAVSWVLQVAKGDQKCPKGGWVEYRNGAWYTNCHLAKSRQGTF